MNASELTRQELIKVIEDLIELAESYAGNYSYELEDSVKLDKEVIRANEVIAILKSGEELTIKE